MARAGGHLMRLVLSSTVAIGALLAAMSPAQADPISIGTLVANTVGAAFGAASAGSTVLATIGATAITVGQVVGTALSVGASIGLSLLGRPKTPKVDPAQTKSTFSTAEGPELRIVGRGRLGGLKLYGNTAGFDSFRLVAHARGPIDGIEETYLGNREVLIEADGAVSSPPYTRPGGSYVSIMTRNGGGTPPAWPALMAAFPDQWTADHLARGIAQSLITYTSPGISEPKWSAMYQGGFPDISHVLRGERVYDPRTGLTVWSDNGILVALHVKLSAPEMTLDDFDLDVIAAEANRADVPVATLTGTEPRARAWGIWSSEEQRSVTVLDVLQSIGAEQVWTPAGKIAFRLIDDDAPPEMEIAEDDIVSLGLNSGPEAVERPNQLVLRYYSPERRYEMAEIDLTGKAWASDQGEIDRTGRREITFDLRFCPSASQAQRVARRLFAKARADGGVLRTNLAGLNAWHARRIGFVSEFGPHKVDTEAPSLNDDTGLVEIPFRELPVLGAWNPAIHEAPAPLPVPDLEYQSDIETPAAATAAVIVTYPDSSVETRLRYAAPPAGITVIEASRRTYTAGQPDPWTGMAEYAVTGFAMATHPAALPLIDTRLRHFNAEEEGSKWSPVAQFTPVADLTAPLICGIAVANNDENSVATLTVTAPLSLNVANIEMAVGENPTPPAFAFRFPVRPGEVVSQTFALPSAGIADKTLTFTARAFAATASGGGPTATITTTVPGTG
jgi:hypothetical protein